MACLYWNWLRNWFEILFVHIRCNCQSKCNFLLIMLWINARKVIVLFTWGCRRCWNKLHVLVPQDTSGQSAFIRDFWMEKLTNFLDRKVCLISLLVIVCIIFSTVLFLDIFLASLPSFLLDRTLQKCLGFFFIFLGFLLSFHLILKLLNSFYTSLIVWLFLSCFPPFLFW